MRILTEEAYPSILQRVKDAGFVVFESNDYDMNIIGERNPNGETNKFDDWIHVLFFWKMDNGSGTLFYAQRTQENTGSRMRIETRKAQRS